LTSLPVERVLFYGAKKMDRNQLLQGLQNPTMEVGVITGKFVHDEELYDECVRNANNAAIAIYCFPGGNQPINHDVWPGYTLLGLKNVSIPESDVFEIGLASAAGFMWDSYCSQRDMESRFYWLGISNGTALKTMALDSTTKDEPGIGTHKAGTKSIINNSWKTIYAGDKLVWRFPKAPFHPRAGKSEQFNEGNPINMLARQGDPPTQFRFEYESYDPTDFAVQMAAAFAALSYDTGQGGVQDMPYQNALPWAAGGAGVKDRPWSSIQEEALAYRYGLWGVALTLLGTLKETGIALDDKTPADIARIIGLFDAKTADVGYEGTVVNGVADVMLDKISPCDPQRERAENEFAARLGMPLHKARQYAAVPESLAGNERLFFANLRSHAIDMLAIGITSALEAKRAQIVGTAMNSAAPADTVHVLFGHFAT